MCMKVKLEIGPHLERAIADVANKHRNAVTSEVGLGPASAIKVAFGINFEKILKMAINKSCKDASIEINIEKRVPEIRG